MQTEKKKKKTSHVRSESASGGLNAVFLNF